MKKIMGQGPMGNMMSEMMQNMQSMGPKDKIAMMTTMMPKCMSMIFSMLEPADRKELAEKMLKIMLEELKNQAKPPEGGSEDEK